MSDIMSISRLRMGTDGKGITTLVAFYGCPLHCQYCLNHECHGERTIRADYTAAELIDVLSLDEPYFLMTGGGVTFGGGEPLQQAEFVHEVCRMMNAKWKRNIETSLYSPWKRIELLLEDIDDWYIDIKDIDSEIYSAYTGKKNSNVLVNLKKLVDAVGPEKVCVRIPLIPDYNTTEHQYKSMEYVLREIHSDLQIDFFEYIKCE